MSTRKINDKVRLYFSIFLTIIGCVLACSTLIPNDYVKFVVVMSTLCVGMYGILRGLSQPLEENS